MNGAQLYAASLYKFIEMSPSPNATAIPDATKSHHFTTGQISIFFIIALLIIAGIISIIYCFHLQKKNARRLNIEIHDPFRTKKVVDSPKHDIHSYNQDDDNSITSLREISDMEDKDETEEQDNENKNNENADDNANNNSININDSNNNLNENLKEVNNRVQIQRAISLPMKTKLEPLAQNQNVNNDDDSYYNVDSKVNENLIKFEGV